MTSNRPYLLRALLEWIGDNRGTPFIVLSAEVPGVDVPPDYVKDGRIVLNVSPTAVRNFSIDQHRPTFDGRFSGRTHRVTAPVGAVVAVYARETGEGMFFDVETPREPPPPPAREPGTAGHLRVVK